MDICTSKEELLLCKNSHEHVITPVMWEKVGPRASLAAPSPAFSNPRKVHIAPFCAWRTLFSGVA